MADLEKPSNELDLLKERADKMGIKYSGNISASTLKERINEKLELDDPKSDTSKAVGNKKLKQEAMKLIRVIVIPNAPEKRNLNGDIFSVSNDVIGTVKMMVPYNNENGWHIPQVIYNLLKDKKYQTFIEKKVDGKVVQKGTLIPAYNITILDPLTDKEMSSLAKAQDARNNLKDD